MPGNAHNHGRKGAGLSWTTILVVLNLIAFNLISLEHFSRFDLTDAKQYTLSADTVRTLGKLKDRVTVKVFISEDLPPGHDAVRGRIVDQLEEIRTFAGDKVNLIYLNPGPGTPEIVEEATGYEIKAEPLRSFRADRRETVMGYMSLAVLYEDRYESIQSLHTRRSLEYDLMMKISRVIRSSPVTVAFQEIPAISDDLAPSVKEDIEKKRKKKNRRTIESQSSLAYIAYRLRELFDVITVDLTRPVPEDVSTLVLSNPHLLDELAIYYADQFLMRGGKLVILKSGVTVDGAVYRCKPDKGALDEWLAHYGIVIEKNVLCDKRCLTYPFVLDAGGGRTFTKELAYPPYLQILGKLRDPAHPITASLDNDLAAPYLSSIDLTAPSGGSKTYLYRTSPKAWEQRAPEFDIHPDRIVVPDEGLFRQFPFCGVIDGTFSSFFTFRSLSKEAYRAAERARQGIRSVEVKAVLLDPPPAGADGAPEGGAPEPVPEDPRKAAPEAPPKSDPKVAPAPGKPGAEESGAEESGAEEPGEEDSNSLKHPQDIRLQSEVTQILVIGSETFLDPPQLQGLREDTYLPIAYAYQSIVQFFLNSVDYLSAGGEFNSIRARDVAPRTIDDPYKDKPNLGLKLFGTGGGVFVILAVGIALVILRKMLRRKEVTL